MKKILIINGSASSQSSNKKLIDNFVTLTKDVFSISLFNDLKDLPHFDADLTVTNTPKSVLDFRQSIKTANGIIICTPEYIFSIPSGLKNALEWCVATTVFSAKPLGIITASASGEKAHEELQLIMETLMATFTANTTLLIQGIKGKINEQGNITNSEMAKQLTIFINDFKDLVSNT